MTLTYLVIGANRGLGLEFVKQLSEKEGCKVLATARDLQAAGELQALARKAGSDKVQLFELDFTSEESLASLTPSLPPFNRLLINAGTNSLRDPLLTSSLDMPSDLLKTFEINVLGPLKTVRALVPVMKDANVEGGEKEGKKVMLMSSELASIERIDIKGTNSPSYSVSKTALNMLGAKLALELTPLDIDLVIMHPGWVKTDMGGEFAPLEPAQSIAGMLSTLESAHTGSFMGWDGKVTPW
ncbi:hypothetical protein BCR35DRAFT_335234 [Leucosporidium creatinivorum]|uniref:Uncharacterized protein n=1 Tax=Leucosporidium creatinivorum TaxID=106004 RepID=A0A1Y2DH02_9BASI|nr:hypothetical protein BCR35DRAFT_335234 [Leucosporidium creatinivorum]